MRAAAMNELGGRASAVMGWLEARRWQALAVTLPVVVAIHLLAAAVTIPHSNQDRTASDQGAEIWLAAISQNDIVPRTTDGVRHPLWSWLARSVRVENEDAFFSRGKWLNTALSVIFLCGLGLAVARWLDPIATANLLLLTSLGIFLVRGTYFQPDPLYYMLSFLAGVLAWRILRGAPAWFYAGFGLVCGLAYLSKPSLLPFLLAFGLAFAVRLALSVLRGEGNWPLFKNLLGLFLAATVFGVMLFPLGRYSQEAFGKPFFNYPKYWMWMDNFDAEAWPWQTKYPGRVQLETIPPGDMPSLSWYFRRHSVADASKRAADGTSEVAVRFLFPETKLPAGAFFWRSPGAKWQQPLAHRGVYLIGLAVLCAGLLWPVRNSALRNLTASGNLAFALFLVVAGGLYLGLYGWYYPIGRGDRFMGSLWLPAVFLLCWWAFLLRRLAGDQRADLAYLSVHLAILLSLLLQITGMFWRFQQGIYLVTRN